MRRLILTLSFVGVSFACMHAQSNNSSSTNLNLESVDDALYLPRLTTNQRDAKNNPKVGSFIFNTDVKCTQYYNGEKWESISSKEIAMTKDESEKLVRISDENGSSVTAMKVTVNGNALRSFLKNESTMVADSTPPYRRW